MSELRMTRLRYTTAIVGAFICGWATNELTRRPNYQWHRLSNAIVLGVVPLLLVVIAVVRVNVLERRRSKLEQR